MGFNSGAISQECVIACPIYEQCREIRLVGISLQVRANTVISPIGGLEFEDEITGMKLTEAQFWGTESLSIAAAILLSESGHLLESAANSFQDLLESFGCDGPTELPNGIAICTSDRSIKSAIYDTYEDMKHHDS